MTSDPLRFEFEWTLQDMREAQKTFGHYYRFKGVLPFMGLIIGMFLLEFAFTAKLDYGLLVALALVPVFLAALRLVARLAIRKLPEHLAGPVNLEFDGDGVTAATRNGESKLKWRAFERCLESENLFLLLQSGGSYRFQIVPKRVMNPQSEAAFRLLVGEKLP